MTVGKTKKAGVSKKGGKKKIVDPFTKKEWYQIKAPSVFKNRNVGFTLVNRTAGTKIAADSLKGRVFETCLADLQNDEDQAHRKIKLRCEDIAGKDLLTTFYGMDLTTDKLRSLVRKWQTLIEVVVDVKTADNFKLRIFTIAFTKRRPNQVKATAFAQTSQVRKLRRKITNIVRRETANAEVKDIVNKFIPESIGKLIEKECQSIYPLKDVFVRKVKTLAYPKFDSYRVSEAHKESKVTEDAGAKLAEAAAAAAVAGPEAAAAPVVAAAGEKIVGE